jgi:hypothetical protein
MSATANKPMQTDGRSAADADRQDVRPMNDPIDRTKTLNELDPPAWGEPEFDSYLVTTCHRLRRKPIDEFTVEDLRIMIGQGIGLDWLVPLALEVLEQDPLSEGDFYPGDLLGSVLQVPGELWSRKREWRDRVKAVLDDLTEAPEELSDAVEAFREHTV